MSPAIVPGKRPAISLVEVAKMAAGYGDAVLLLGLRGFFKDFDGGENKRGIYDDAIILYSPGRIVTFNANTDPQGFRKGVASLMPGFYAYKVGIHGLSKPKEKQYEALVQAAPVNVMRDGFDSFDTGFFGLNVHRGSYGSVSSLGCQTIYPSQWPEFITTVKTQMKSAGQERISYVLREV